MASRKEKQDAKYQAQKARSEAAVKAAREKHTGPDRPKPEEKK
jgi:hypothetical protein